MKIGPGDNTLKVVGFRKGYRGLRDIYQFEVSNLAGTKHGFAYAVDPGSATLPQIVTDLRRLHALGLWVVMYLKETNRMLAIHTIKEPNVGQQELENLYRQRSRISLN